MGWEKEVKAKRRGNGREGGRKRCKLAGWRVRR